MENEYLLKAIVESCREVDEDESCEVCSDCWNEKRKEREFILKRISQPIEFHLSEIEQLMYDIVEAEFYSDEGMLPTSFYEKLDEAYKCLDVVKKLAEIKKFLEARNLGIIGRILDDFDRQKSLES